MNTYNHDSEVTQKKRKIPKLIKIIILAVVTIVAIVTVASTINIVPAGHVGAKYRMGALVTTDLSAGPHISIPFVENIKNIDVREKSFELDMTAYTKDTQVIENIKVKINYTYDLQMLPKLIQNVGLENVEARLLLPNTTSITKNMTGKYKAEELIQNRSGLQESVEDEIRAMMAEQGILITNVNIEDIDFENSFEENIRNKVAAEVKAQQTRNETETKKEEANQKIVAAEAEAQSAKIAADAEAYAIKAVQEQLAQSPEYIEYERIQKWNGQYPEVMGNTVNPFVTLK